VYTPGKMVENMMENINTIKNTVTESIHGQMEGDMKVNGLLVNNTVKENTYYPIIQ